MTNVLKEGDQVTFMSLGAQEYGRITHICSGRTATINVWDSPNGAHYTRVSVQMLKRFTNRGLATPQYKDENSYE